MKFAKKMMAVLALVPGLVFASEGGFPLERAPERHDLASLQNGAKLFINYCLNCHSASAMRYNRLRDLGLSEEKKTRMMPARRSTSSRASSKWPRAS